MGERLFDRISNYKIKIEHYDFPEKLEKKFFEKSGMNIIEITFSAEDLLYDIATCGMPAFWINESAHKKRFEEIMYKIYLMRTALEVDNDGYIIVSDNIKYLDPSEKNFISYYIGMFTTKLVSREIFGYDYLVHLGIVSIYKKIVRDKKKPDLVGFKKKEDEYSLFEAKGRQSIRLSMINNAKAQIKSVAYINGKKPFVGVVCVTHPIKEGYKLVCSLYDPIPDEDGRIDVNKSELLYLYYLPIYELIKEKGNGKTFCNIYFNEINDKNMKFQLKMSEELFKFFTEHSNFDELHQKDFFSKLMEFKSFSSNKSKDDLLKIKLCISDII